MVKIVITINGKDMEFTPEEARRLLKELEAIGGERNDPTYPVYPDPIPWTYPVYPDPIPWQYPYYYQAPWTWTTVVTCKDYMLSYR